MAAYAALVSLLNTIQQIQSHPTLSTSLDNKHTQPLLEKTGSLLDFIEGNSYGGGSKEAADLERQITSAAQAAQDLIESHIADQIHMAKHVIESIEDLIYEDGDLIDSNIADLFDEGCHLSDGSEDLQRTNEEVEQLTDRSEESLDLQHIIEVMDAITKEANQFKEKRILVEEQQQTNAAKPLGDGEEIAMVGLDDELYRLLDELNGHQSSRRIISIVGMGGKGKTTLAKAVYENLLIKETFQCRAWATISQQHNAQEVLSNLLSSLGESMSGTVDDLGLHLHKTLSGRRYLIVLDDIWSVRGWDEVRHFFPDYQNRSRVLLTTRLSNVATDCGSSIFMLSFLNEESSWKLFCSKAFQDKDCPSELHEVGKEIVELCKGLALSIVVIGGLLLKSPKTIEYWKGVVEHLRLIPDSKEKQESLDVLSLSYNHLPPHLKPCFLYIGVFKEDSKIKISRIVSLWVAEGFIKPNSSELLEETAKGFIQDLIDRNLILVRKRCVSGDIRSCGIHDLLRELCIKVAQQEGFFQVLDDTTRGVVHCVVDGMHLGRAKVTLPRVGSIMKSGSVEDPTKYRLLRVFDGNTRHFKLVDCFGNVNLRFLAYNLLHLNISEWKLPTFVSFMWNLQTLNIINSFEYIIVMPTEFWNMRQLRHVECSKFYVPGPPLSNVQDGSLMLDNLHTCVEIVNLRLCEEVCMIISNIKELDLWYDDKLQGYDYSFFVESLSNLDRLYKLEVLDLRGRWNLLFPNREPEMNRTTSFPRSLKKLTLLRLKVKWDDLTIIGSLPQLEVLKLEQIIEDGVDSCWSPLEGQFQRLKLLEIQYCSLERWDAEESHFPVLEKLILISLLYLKEIPLCIGNIATLELIHLSGCSASASISAIRIKEDQLDNGSQLLQVQVTMWPFQLEEFNQMLETEELTTNNIEYKESRW